MAQHDYVIDNSTGANVRSDINNVLQAIASNNSGSSDPSTTVASQFFADTNAGILKLRNTSNNGYVNLFTLAGGVDVDAASNFNEDVTFTGASANIVFDKSDNALEFADNAKATFGNDSDIQISHDGLSTLDDTKIKVGTGADVEIFHNGTNSFITNNTGAFLLDADNLQLRSTAGEIYVSGTANGASKLRFDDSVKLETVSSGLTVSGNLQPSADNDSNMALGQSNRRWKKVFAGSGTIDTSDRNEKNSIVESDLGLDFINKLNPVSFKWNKDDGKTHYGLIAQDIEQTIISLGKNIEDFGAIDKEENSPMGLNYSQLLSPLIKAVQELSAKVAALESN